MAEDFKVINGYRHNEALRKSFNELAMKTYGIDFEKERGIKGGKVKNVRDLWLHQDLGAMSGRYSVRLEPHSCKVLRIKPNSKRYKAAVASLRNGAVINR